MKHPGLVFRPHSSHIGATGIFAAVMVLLSLSAALAQQSIMVSPQVTQLEMTPGSRKAFEIVVANASETSPIVVHLGVSSIGQNERGDYRVVKGENEWSCASWITVAQTTISLGPGEAVPVRCMIQAPFTGGGGRYAAVTIAFGNTGRGTAPLSTSFEYMLGSYVEVTMVSGLSRRSVGISNLQVVPVRGNRALENQYGDDAFFITAEVENSGNIGLIAEATL